MAGGNGVRMRQRPIIHREILSLRHVSEIVNRPRIGQVRVWATGTTCCQVVLTTQATRNEAKVTCPECIDAGIATALDDE